MLIPLKDHNPTFRTPFVTIFLIVLNCVIFFYQAFFSDAHYQRRMEFQGVTTGYWSSSLQYYVYNYGLIPAEIFSKGNQPLRIEDEKTGRFIVYSRTVNPMFTFFSSMFMHGSLLHLLGNMLYLWIFGNNIEDRLGAGKFILFYLLGGIAADFAHLLFNLNSFIPVIGASGAVSAVMGAYLILYPQARIVSLLFLFIFFTTVEIPAFFFLVFWFLMQFFYAGSASGIAWLAHVGGFIAGILMLKLFLPSRRVEIFY